MWMDEEDAHLEERDVRDLVNKFNEMLKESSSVYFDVDQLELIIEYYLENFLPEKAMKAVQHGLELFSNNEFLLLRKAQISVTVGDLDGAKEIFKRLLISDAQNSEILFGLGMIEAQEHAPKKAVSYYKLAFDQADSEFQTEILVELALQYQFLHQPEKSLICYRRALETGFNTNTVLREFHNCIERHNQLVEGTQILEDYVDKNPYSLEGWFFLGSLFGLAGATEKAIDCYDYSIIIKEENPDAYFRKAQSLIKLERYEEALEAFNKEITYREPVAFNYCMIADCHEQLGDFNKAEAYYQKALKQDATYSEAYLGLGFLSELKFESAKAISYYEEAIKMDGHNVNAHLLLSNLLCSKEKFKTANLLIQEFLKEEDSIEEMWLELGEIHSKSKDYEKALEVITLGIEQAASNEKLWLKKVVYLHKKGAVKESLELMRELLEEDKSITNAVKEFCTSLLNDSSFSNLINQYA